MNERGFTLMEVLVAFAILTSVLTALLQTQGDSILFAKKTNELILARDTTTQMLLKLERTKPNLITEEEGEFADDHPMAGSKWQLKRKREKIMNLISIEKAEVTVIWFESGKERRFSASIIIAGGRL